MTIEYKYTRDNFVTSSGVVIPNSLTYEIEVLSTISGTLSHINTAEVDIDIHFEDILSSDDEDTLNQLVHDHPGTYYPRTIVGPAPDHVLGYEIQIATTTNGMTIVYNEDADEWQTKRVVTEDDVVDPYSAMNVTLSGVVGNWIQEYDSLASITSVDNVVHVNANYDGDVKNGGLVTPFVSIAEAATHVNTTYSGTGESVAILLLPGEYVVPHKITVTNPNVKAIMGTDMKAVVIKPTDALLGDSFVDVYTELNASNLTFDASDNPAFTTASGSIGINFLSNGFSATTLNNIKVNGFKAGIKAHNSTFIYSTGLEVSNAERCLCLASGVKFNTTNSIFLNAYGRHVCAKSGASVNLNNCYISSPYPPFAGMGTAVRVTDENTEVSILAGSYLKNVDKLIEVYEGGKVEVDGSYLNPALSDPGIVQDEFSYVSITNSIAPLAYEQLQIENPTGCNIYSYDNESGSLVMGSHADVDQDVFVLDTGAPDRPTFSYKSLYGGWHKVLFFESTVSGIPMGLGTRSYDDHSAVGAVVAGPNSHNYMASLPVCYEEAGMPKGWALSKDPGVNPSFRLHKYENPVDTGFRVDTDYNFYFNTGVGVNAVLNETDFASYSAGALATQYSIGEYVKGYTYSTTATDDLLNTLSGTMDDKFVWRDGSKELTSDWDVGPHNIEADGFVKDNVRVDYASYCNITGILSGGTLSVNGTDDTLLDVEAGKSIYVDMTDRDNPIVEILSWPAQTFDPELLGDATKWVGITRTAPGVGGLIASHKFSQSNKRQIAVLGRIWNFDLQDTIAGIGEYKETAFSDGKTVQDLAYALGALNVSGNAFCVTASGSMKLSRTAGEAFRYGANYINDDTSSNIYNSLTASGISSYFYQYQGGASQNLTDINPDDYDVSGTLTSVPSGKWTVQRIYYYPVSDVVAVTYGQALYDDLEDAELNFVTESVVLNNENLEGSILRAFLAIKEGCTDLTNTAEAKIIQATNIGAGGGGAGGGGVEDHGALTGLLDDDHPQYTLIDGTRDFTGKVNYNVHPTFTEDTELVDKKYVDDEIDNLTTDHGELTGLLDDDHPQYHNDLRGDQRYYTQTQINTISGALDDKILAGSSNYFNGYDGAGTTQLGGNWTDIPLTEQGFISDAFTHTAGSAEVTIAVDSTYIIIGRFTVFQPSGSSRSEAEMQLAVDTGGGYQTVPGTTGNCYSRTSAQSKTTASAMAILTLSAGAKIKLQAKENSGGTLFGQQDGSGLMIFNTSGEVGPQGVQGPAGQDGINAGGTMSVVQLRRTTDYGPSIPLSWTDFFWDTTDVEYDDTVLDHDDTNRDRVLIKRDGCYMIHIHGSMDDEVQFRVRKNDSTVLPGSEIQVGDISQEGDAGTTMAISFVADLVDGDYITMQVQSHTDYEFTRAGFTMIVYELLGAKGADGDPGPPGSGSTLNIYEDGSPIQNTPHSNINFTGADVTVTDAGSGQVNVNIASQAQSVFGSEFFDEDVETETNTSSTSPVTKATLNVTGIPAGKYRIGWYYEWRRNTTSNDYRAYIKIDSSTLSDHREEGQDVNSWRNQSGFAIRDLSSGNHTIVMQHYGESSSYTSYTRRVRLEFWRIS